MQQNLVIDIPFTAEATISSRSRKYVTCLQMVHCIISREVSADIPIDLFNQLGIVAGFIDQHLDELNIDEQRRLLAQYDKLFEKLWTIDHYLVFRNEICQFVEQQNFVFNCEAIYLKDLFLFLQHCKTEGIKSNIQSFGKAIISIAIDKQEVTKSDTLIQLLRMEGEAVVGLLRALLQNNYGEHTTLEPTLQLLQELEHILNLADDTLDVTTDKRNNRISATLGPLHRIRILKQVTLQILKTIKSYPRKTLGYAPRLTWFYFKNTL